MFSDTTNEDRLRRFDVKFTVFFVSLTDTKFASFGRFHQMIVMHS